MIYIVSFICVTFFQTELLLKVRIMDEHQVIAGTIKDLSILAGIYNTAKRSDWIYQVKILIKMFTYDLYYSYM